ncbi:hypothetical protein [Desertimonas flava]|uniref:hypothetical protein n=1 Tax=Desertimonas flava TaxID=2064846 RepID=UPI0013C4729E|nr:hypothetical protein [Desertimonas flava]
MAPTKKHSDGLKVRAVRLVVEVLEADPSLSLNAAAIRVGERLRVSPTTLRAWCRQAGVQTTSSSGQSTGASSQAVAPSHPDVYRTFGLPGDLPSQTALQVQISRIRRRWWLVAAGALVGIVAGIVSWQTGETLYSSKAALTVVSAQRGPEQDAIMSQGYVSYFNDPSYQAKLRQQAGIAGDVSFKAETVVASPILYVIASSPNADDVVTAASRMATALRDQVNDGVRANREASVAAVLDALEATDGLPGQVQDRISAITADNTNELQVVQLESAVTSTTPGPIRTIALPLAAGLVVGCFAAMAFGAASRRLESAFDVSDRTGLEVLTVLPRIDRRGGVAQFEQRVGQLANVVSRFVQQRPMVVAVAGAGTNRAASFVARALAVQRGSHGERTILVDAEGATSEATGASDYIADIRGVTVHDVAQDGPAANVLVVPWGEHAEGPPAGGAERFDDLLGKLRANADVVIIDCPPIVDAADAQVLCAAADVTLIAIEESATRTADVVNGVRLVEHVGGLTLGAVLIERGGVPERHQSGAG